MSDVYNVIQRIAIKRQAQEHNRNVRSNIISVLEDYPSGLITGRLYEEYCNRFDGFHIRTLRKHLRDMIDMGVVVAEPTGEGFKGRSRVIKLSNEGVD